MHGPGLIVAEREETDKKVLPRRTIFLCGTLRLCVIDFNGYKSARQTSRERKSKGN